MRTTKFRYAESENDFIFYEKPPTILGKSYYDLRCFSQPISFICTAFFPTKLQTKIETDNAMDGTIIEFFKQTNACQQGVMDLKTSMTAARASKMIDLGFCKIVFKLDLLNLDLDL